MTRTNDAATQILFRAPGGDNAEETGYVALHTKRTSHEAIRVLLSKLAVVLPLGYSWGGFLTRMVAKLNIPIAGMLVSPRGTGFWLTVQLVDGAYTITAYRDVNRYLYGPKVRGSLRVRYSKEYGLQRIGGTGILGTVAVHDVLRQNGFEKVSTFEDTSSEVWIVVRKSDNVPVRSWKGVNAKNNAATAAGVNPELEARRYSG